MSSIPPPPPPPPLSPPPGYVAYGGPGDVSGFQSTRGLAKAIVVLLWIDVPLQVLTIFSQLRIARKARQFLRGSITESDFRNAVQRNIAVGVSALVLPIAVLTIIWMFRMAANLRRYGRPGQTWKPGWGIAGWFLPPCGVFAIPWLMFRELWKGSDVAVPPNDPNWKRGSVTRLIDVWWVLFGLVPLIGIGSGSSFGQLRAGTWRSLAERLRDYNGLNVALSVIAIGTTIVYINLVRQLSARHAQLTRES